MNFTKSYVLTILLVLFLGEVSSYRILVVFPAAAKSHYNLGKGVADILHQKKHEVIFASPFKSDKPLSYREIVLTEVQDKKREFEKMIGFNTATQSKLTLIKNANTQMPLMFRKMFENPDWKQLLNNKAEKFDVVVTEYIMNEVFIGLGVRFDCPVVLVSTVSMMSWLATLTGNPISPGTVPNVFLPYSNNMNLWQRTVNTAVSIVQEVMGKLMMEPTQKGLYEELFPAESNIVPYEDLSSKVALVLINSHPSLNVARPLLPNAIEVGGYHIDASQPLPQDLQELLDSTKEGVIYFSMGSNLKSADMSIEIQQGILKVFAKLKQTVLWKFEEELPGKPDNVIIRKWMPQSAILAHRNVKVFISHGGLLSCTEAVHYGVPILAIPIFGDQNHNAIGVVERGHGLMVEYTNFTETSLTWALNEMLSNPIYEQNAKRIHDQYHDRAMNPKDTVAFYIEHAVRSGGAPHLNPIKLPRYSDLLLDVFVVIAIPPILLLILLVGVCKRCLKTKQGKAKQISSKSITEKQKRN